MRRFWVPLTIIAIVLIVATTFLLPGEVIAPAADPSPSRTTTLFDTATPSMPPSQIAEVAPTVYPTPLPTLSSPTITPVKAQPSPEDMLTTIKTTERPARDMNDLIKRVKLKPSEQIVTVVNSGQPSYEVGHSDTFSIADQQARSYFTITATVQIVTPHAYFYVQDGLSIDQDQLRRSAEAFEDSIYPIVRRYFGTEPDPGIDNDPRITILNAVIPGVGGYFSTADAHSRQVQPYSNEREMIYINVAALRPGTPNYNATLAHEFQHMVHWNTQRGDDTWINEGAAELAMRLTGHDTGGTQDAFLANPDVQLNDWAEEPSQTIPHYGAAYLFMSYLAERCGGYDALREAMAQPGNDQERFDRYLRDRGLSFDQVFADWVVANYLDDPGLNGGRFGYQDIDVQLSPSPIGDWQGEQSGEVNQYAADYIELSSSNRDLVISFDGTDLVKVVPNDAHSGRMQWWSNRGDVMDTSLTRRFDLSGVTKATLSFWAWYDIEKNYDFAYVMVSDDDGETWKTMPGQFTTSDNSVGANLGHGYTGMSGEGQQPSWVHEEIDLSAYAGKQILVRFEYVTDDAYNRNGFCVDDIAIAELGFDDSVEEASSWEARGFVWLSNAIPQRFAVQLITRRGQYDVQTVNLDAKNSGQVTIKGLGQELEEAVLVVAAMSPGTTEPAQYSYTIRTP